MQVFRNFFCIRLSYIDYSTINAISFPTVSVCSIYNDSKLIIESFRPGTDEVENQEIFEVNDYEVIKLFYDIQDILREDEFNSEPPELRGEISIDFEIIYNLSGHREKCSPLLKNKEGITILSMLEGFVAFAKKEHTYYNWCSVEFSEYGKEFSYFSDDDSIKIGDYVFVPVGKNNKEKMAKVVNQWWLTEERLPFPAEKTKKILRKVPEELIPRPIDLDKFLETADFNDDFILTDIDGTSHEVHFCGDYRNDDEPGLKPNEPYIKCGRVHCAVRYAQSRIWKIELTNECRLKKIDFTEFVGKRVEVKWSATGLAYYGTLISFTPNETNPKSANSFTIKFDDDKDGEPSEVQMNYITDIKLI